MNLNYWKDFPSDISSRLGTDLPAHVLPITDIERESHIFFNFGIDIFSTINSQMVNKVFIGQVFYFSKATGFIVGFGEDKVNVDKIWTYFVDGAKPCLSQQGYSCFDRMKIEVSDGTVLRDEVTE